MENKNYLDNKRNMIVVLVVIGLLAAAAIVLLLVAPRVARSNSPDVIGGDDDNLLTGGEGAQRVAQPGRALPLPGQCHSRSEARETRSPQPVPACPCA